MKFFRGKKLIGVNAIMLFLGLRYVYSVSDWIIHYDLPARKENGVWTAFTSDLKKWKADHPDIVETGSWQPAEKIEFRRVRARWGLERIERRKITY